MADLQDDTSFTALGHQVANSCVFCEKIGANDGVQETEPDSNIFYFEPLNPVTPGHTLFVAKLHTADAADNPWLTGVVYIHAARYARQQMQSFNLITSAGRYATQTVPHLHVHYVPRRPDDGLHLPWTNQVKVTDLQLKDSDTKTKGNDKAKGSV